MWFIARQRSVLTGIMVQWMGMIKSERTFFATMKKLSLDREFSTEGRTEDQTVAVFGARPP